MKKTLLTLLLFSLSLSALAQQRPGGGPDDYDLNGKSVISFLDIVKENGEKCGLEIFSRTIIDFQVLYNLHYAKERSSAQCDENGIPAKFKCILDAKAQDELIAMLADNKPIADAPITRYYKRNHIDDKASASNLGFLRKLLDRLQKSDEK